MTNVTRLCHTKSMVTVNGQFPGPKIIAREGDRVVVKVVNHVQSNITIHWYNEKSLKPSTCTILFSYMYESYACFVSLILSHMIIFYE